MMFPLQTQNQNCPPAVRPQFYDNIFSNFFFLYFSQKSKNSNFIKKNESEKDRLVTQRQYSPRRDASIEQIHQ